MAESIHRIAFDEYGKMVEADSDKAKLLEWWLNNWPGRKLFKPAIMPYIYGRKYLSLQHLITEQLIQQFQHSQSEEGHQSVSLGHSLARVIHLGVKRTMPDLLRLSDWLSAGAARMIQQGLEPSWHTPNGLKIRSYTSVTRKCRMLLVLSGKKVSIQIKDNEDAPLDTTTSHVTADFIHSMDAAFLQHFVHQWDGPIVAVHDCFGTTLDRVHVLRDDLAEQFQKFYQSCHLMNHYRYLAEHGIDVGLPPMVNTLDVEQIGDNPFLFT
jgi:DNA-directed RNA polymerase